MCLGLFLIAPSHGNGWGLYSHCMLNCKPLKAPCFHFIFSLNFTLATHCAVPGASLIGSEGKNSSTLPSPGNQNWLISYKHPAGLFLFFRSHGVICILQLLLLQLRRVPEWTRWRDLCLKEFCYVFFIALHKQWQHSLSDLLFTSLCKNNTANECICVFFFQVISLQIFWTCWTFTHFPLYEQCLLLVNILWTFWYSSSGLFADPWLTHIMWEDLVLKTSAAKANQLVWEWKTPNPEAW